MRAEGSERVYAVRREERGWGVYYTSDVKPDYMAKTCGEGRIHAESVALDEYRERMT